MSRLEELEKLAELKKKKILSEAEFESQKKALLSENLKEVEKGTAKSRLAYLLLAWFLGVLGIHNFYIGRNGVAIAQLLITLLIGIFIVPLIAVWIWVLIEMVTVTQDASGQPMSWP